VCCRRPPTQGVAAMARSQSVLIPVALVAAALCLLAQQAFVAPSAPALRSVRSLNIARFGGGPSVPTGLVWPSPEAADKLREVDGIKMYPTHAWTADMTPIMEAAKKLDDAPVIIGVAADSGCGKSTFLRRILGALGTEVVPGHTAVGDMMTVVCLDDYHTNDRAGRKATGYTALDAKENDFALMGTQIEALKQKKAVYKPIYNHDTGFKDPPELLQPNKVMVFEGLHPIYDEKARNQLDLSIYIDIVNEVKFDWKVKRDVEERGWTEQQVRDDINKRLPDFSAYVDVQKKNADVVLRYEPSDKGLPFLKVKLIQKKGSAFPPITLKKDLTLTGSVPGAVLKMYDDNWEGNAVTVVEMDGEIDMDNMEAQLEMIEENIEGLGAKSKGEFTSAMVKLKSSPGSQNGTGMLQTIIAMKVREVYEKITGKVVA
jgi:phosphoribulokinase